MDPFIALALVAALAVVFGAAMAQPRQRTASGDGAVPASIADTSDCSSGHGGCDGGDGGGD